MVWSSLWNGVRRGMIVTILIILILILAHQVYKAKKNLKLERDSSAQQAIANQVLLSQKKSSEVRLGLTAEKLAPFLDEFPSDPKYIQFLGNPIDYIAFEPDCIKIIEVKSGNARLSKAQKNIKKLIDDIDSKYIQFHMYRIKG